MFGTAPPSVRSFAAPRTKLFATRIVLPEPFSMPVEPRPVATAVTLTTSSQPVAWSSESVIAGLVEVVRATVSRMIAALPAFAKIGVAVAENAVTSSITTPLVDSAGWTAGRLHVHVLDRAAELHVDGRRRAQRVADEAGPRLGGIAHDGDRGRGGDRVGDHVRAGEDHDRVATPRA